MSVKQVRVTTGKKIIIAEGQFVGHGSYIGANC
jgi:hypothetical protein